jgi:1-aminocyclopropane-1-carboxylate deaminase
MDFFNTSASIEQQIKLPLFEEKKIEVWMKRDDLLHPFVSGNKYRKLKYIVEDAITTEKSHLVTFGGAYSNHLVATASTGAAFGLKTTAIVRGEEKFSNSMLSICKLYGMDMVQVSREKYKDKDAAFNRFFKDDTKVYRIEEGGYSYLGAKGCADLIGELKQTYNHIFCAVGTGTTLAGLISCASNNTTTHGIVVLKGAEYLKEEIEALLTPGTKQYELHHNFHFGGYGKFDIELMDFIKEFAQQTGILLDPVYTAKMMKGVISLAQQDFFKRETKILVIHTGGLWGLTSEKASTLSQSV